MDTDEVIIWVCVGVAILLSLLFFFFAITTGGIKAFAIYVLFPVFIISFLVGITMLVNLIIKLNDKIDNNALGLNKKIDTNNFMIKDSIDNVDDYLQNVDYTMIVEDRNVPIIVEEIDQLGNAFRYNPKFYVPSLEIPIVTRSEEGLKDIDLLTEDNIKAVVVEINTDIIAINKTSIILEKNIEAEINEDTVYLDSNSIAETLSINQTIEDDSNSIFGTIDDLLSINTEPLEYYELLDESYEKESTITDSYILQDLHESNPLNLEFLYSYNLFEE